MSELTKFEIEDLKNFTDNLSEENFICHAQFCKLYRGKIPDGREVTVKVWMVGHGWVVGQGWEDACANFRDEITFLEHHGKISCPNLPKLLGWCRNDDTSQLGVVYDLKSVDVLRNLIEEDSFNWSQRINVVVGLANLLEHLHGYSPRYLIRDLSAAQIMLDKDLNPVLFNFFGLTGGVIGEKTHDLDRVALGSWGYIDADQFDTGRYEETIDVFAFGVILLELIYKCKVDCIENIQRSEFYYYLHEHVGQYYKPGRSFVDKSFKGEAGFDACVGRRITELTRMCILRNAYKRPSSKEIVKELKTLPVVQKHISFCKLLGSANPLLGKVLGKFRPKTICQ